MWQISSSDGTRWVRCDDQGQISTSPGLEVESNFDVPLTVNGSDFYRPTGPGDPVAVYLRAVNQLGAGARTEGVVPAVRWPRRDPVPADTPPGLVF